MTREEAIEIAKKTAEANGWPWSEPVQAIKRGFFPFKQSWEVLSNADRRGANVLVEIDERSGSIRRSAFLPR